MKRLMVISAAILLTSCGIQSGSSAATKAELASINQHIATLSARMSTLEKSVQDQSASTWVLWQVTKSTNAGYPQALTGYSSKANCLAGAAEWSYPGSKEVAQDPSIFQFKGYRILLECLPLGVTPYSH